MRLALASLVIAKLPERVVTPVSHWRCMCGLFNPYPGQYVLVSAHLIATKLYPSHVAQLIFMATQHRGHLAGGRREAHGKNDEPNKASCGQSGAKQTQESWIPGTHHHGNQTHGQNTYSVCSHL
uniref:Uncharacterized protein n=1 Tax=Myotis myotis TaxID=51298 RepID=A0A7J8AMP8_MYOMY|nr:hypothetical protein mMyoMyo1_008171 [Myotis myotis]